MAIVKGGHEEPQPAREHPDRPKTCIELLYELSGDPARCRWFIAIVCVPIGACCLGIALVGYVIVIAAKGIHGLSPAYIPPAAILTGASLLTWIVSRVRKAWLRRTRKGSRDGAATGGKPSDRR